MRAIAQKGEVLEDFLSKTRDRKAVLKFLRKILKWHRHPHVFVTDKHRSCAAALKDPEVTEDHQFGRLRYNLAANSLSSSDWRFRRMRTRQKNSPPTILQAKPSSPRDAPCPAKSLQGSPRLRSCQVARSLHSRITIPPAPPETRSHLFASTHPGHPAVKPARAGHDQGRGNRAVIGPATLAIRRWLPVALTGK